MKQQGACHSLEVSSLTSSRPKSQVPGGMSLMECHYAINSNATHSAEVMIRNSKDATGYDFRNVMQYAGDPISGPEELSTRSTLLFDMAQASQQLSALNYGSCCASEYSSFATASNAYAACYNSTSPEETDSILRPLVDEFKDGLIGSRSSSQGFLGPLLDRSDVDTAFVTTSKVGDDEGILHFWQEDDEAAFTGLVMEKILRDHFQDTSEPSSYPRKIPTVSFSTNNPSPTSKGRRELEDRSHLDSPRSSSSRIECAMSREASSSGQPDQLARIVSSEFHSMPPTFRRPLEITCGSELKTHRKWKQQRPSGALGLYQSSHPFICAPSSKEENLKTRSTLMTDGVEQASSRLKRRRTRICRGDSSAETQRMTHIAVERNRRKQMNDHLSALKALMPSTFVHKTDQASIIGGAVEFVKELEVLLESLLSKQRRRNYAGILGPSWTRFSIGHPPGPLLYAPYTAAAGTAPSVLSTTAESEDVPTGRLSSKRTIMSSELLAVIPENARVTNEVRAECRSAAATVEVKVLGIDAIVNITTHRRARQLVKLIVAFESLHLNILHTSVTTSNDTVLYTFNAKVGPECRMTVNQIAAALHQTFTCIYANHVR